ncbi:hypothetical protein HHUSO_G25472 [Huso huso]|uniref:Uncharacterized protein n=1 Tax=Huso huso TaxID=61971 RepID=A0ABR0YPY2_HUSHU
MNWEYFQLLAVIFQRLWEHHCQLVLFVPHHYFQHSHTTPVTCAPRISSSPPPAQTTPSPLHSETLHTPCLTSLEPNSTPSTSQSQPKPTKRKRPQTSIPHGFLQQYEHHVQKQTAVLQSLLDRHDDSRIQEKRRKGCVIKEGATRDSNAGVSEGQVLHITPELCQTGPDY